MPKRSGQRTMEGTYESVAACAFRGVFCRNILNYRSQTSTGNLCDGKAQRFLIKGFLESGTK